MLRNKLKWIVMLSFIVFTLVACGGETTQNTDEPTTEIKSTTENTKDTTTIESNSTEELNLENEEINLEYEDGRLEYLSYEVLQDYEGNPLILIHFNFTNTSNENKSAQLLFDVSVFQNGVECEFGIMMDTNEAYNNLIKELQPGTTLEVAFPYVLQDTTTPVDLEVSPLFDFSGTKQSQTINLK